MRVIAPAQRLDEAAVSVRFLILPALDWREELESQLADVTREVDGGLQTVGLKLPAIVTTDLEDLVTSWNPAATTASPASAR